MSILVRLLNPDKMKKYPERLSHSDKKAIIEIITLNFLQYSVVLIDGVWYWMLNLKPENRS